jgi:hypothetical protein
MTKEEKFERREKRRKVNRRKNVKYMYSMGEKN